MSDMNPNKDAVIIGGGISGLATAFRLQKAGLDVLLLEKAGQVGGAIHTEIQDGFLVDCGPNSTLDTSPKIRGFIEEIGLQDSRVNANDSANRRYILREGLLQPLPMNPPQFLISKLFSTRAKFRLLAEPFIAPAPEESEETIAEFVRRRLGTEFLDYAINPFVAGVYAGDPKRLSVRSAVAKIYALEKNYGSLIKGTIKSAKARKKRAEIAKPKAELFSFKKGMGQLSSTLHSLLAERIETGVEIEGINLRNDLENFFTIRYTSAGKRISVQTKCVIFTTPAYVTADYLSAFDAALTPKLEGIVYAPVAVVFLGFRQPPRCRSLDGFGFLVPEVENRRVLGSVWSSTIFPNRAPENGVALTTFVGGMRQPDLVDLDDGELTALVLKELSDVMALADKPDVVKIKRRRRAIPQYEIGHQNRLDAIATFESQHPGIFISGNFRSGISVGDCIVHSEGVGEKVVEFCNQSVPVSQHGEVNSINIR